MTLLPGNAFVLHIDTGRTWRGGQGQVLTLSRGLREKGVRQALVAPPDSPLAERATKAGIDVMSLRMRGEFDFLAAWRLRKIIRSTGAALVHAHDAHAHALAWRATAGLRGVALVVSRRVDFEVSHNWFSRRKYLDPRVRYFAISNGVRDVLVRGGIAGERITVVPSGVDAARFTYSVPREALRREFAIPDGAPIIGTIGSLVDHKSQRYLVDAAPAVLARYPDARFIIVGDGELRPDLERQIAALGLGKSVLLVGFRGDVELFLSGFDIYALSSHLEGLCTSLIDAMLFRVPVVATRTGGVPDLVRDAETGLLVPPKDPAALAEGILKLLNSPTMAQDLAKRAHAHALEHFTAESLVRNTIEAYANVLRSDR